MYRLFTSVYETEFNQASINITNVRTFVYMCDSLLNHSLIYKKSGIVMMRMMQ